MIQKENQTEYELYQGSKFYNNSFKKWLKDNNIEMYSIYSEGKSFLKKDLQTYDSCVKKCLSRCVK